MVEQFVPYEIALKLKELGFNLPCFAWYYIPEIERTGDIILHYTERGKEIQECSTSSMCVEYRKYLKAEHCCNTIQNRSKHIVTAPLYQQIFKWFREEYDICWFIKTEYPNNYGLYIHNGEDYNFYRYNSYEQAENECLNHLINLLKSKQNDV